MNIRTCRGHPGYPNKPRQSAVCNGRSRGSARSGRRGRQQRIVWHIVGINPVVIGVRHPHDLAIGPDAACVVIVSPCQSVELFAGIPQIIAHAVGVDPVFSIVSHPHGGAIGPDALRVSVAGTVQDVNGARQPDVITVCHIIAVDLFVAPVRHPHSLLAGIEPYAPCVPGMNVVLSQVVLLILNPRTVGQTVGVNVIIMMIRHPHGGAVGPNVSCVVIAAGRRKGI